MTGVEVEVSRVAAETDITSMLSRIEGPNPSWGQHDDILSLTTVATRLAGVEVPQGTESGALLPFLQSGVAWAYIPRASRGWVGTHLCRPVQRSAVDPSWLLSERRL